MARRKHKNFTQEQKDIIIASNLEGLSSRAICRKLGISESMKSSVNRFLAAHREESEEITEDILKDEFALEEVSDEVLETIIAGDDKAFANLAKRLRTAQRTCNTLRKIQRGVFDGSVEDGKSFEDTLKVLVEKLTSDNISPTYRSGWQEDACAKTVEVLFSDLQIGKCSQFYNTKVAKKALVYYGEQVLSIVEDTQPEHIVFASLGDIMEDHLKHGVQSAISTDTGLAEQMADAIKHVWEDVLQPLFALKIPVTFIGIQGNHGSSEHKGMDMYQAGRYGYDYTVYRTWQTMCDIAGHSHVVFKLPIGCFETHDIYGQKYLYEHGYSNQVSEKQMEDHKKKRQENLKEYIHGYRQGDKHHTVQYDNSTLMCNGAFFGIEQQGAEYSGILGFNSIPAQAVVIHEPVSGVGESTIVEVKQIQIAKGY